MDYNFKFPKDLYSEVRIEEHYSIWLTIRNGKVENDGEKILGRLPEFKIASTIFDMFGKDFIGVGSDRPIYYDKQLLVRVNKV